MARPEILFPLFADIATLPGVGPRTLRMFEKLGVTRVVDLIFLLPHGLIDRRLRRDLSDADPGQVVTVMVLVGEHRAPRNKAQPYRISASVAGEVLEIVFFHAHRDWISRMLPSGERRIISGRLESYDGRLQMAHPDLILRESEADELPAFEPVYPLTQGLTQRMLAKAVKAALERLPDLAEWLDPAMMEREGWPGWAQALTEVHQPDSPRAVGHGAQPRRRLAYDELLSHQLALHLARERMRRGHGRENRGDGRLRTLAIAEFGHPPTGAQKRALAEIESDMGAETRMMRLLQGDVGSGKTWVAMMGLLIAVEAGGQGALRAPTEILARQHGAGLARMAEAAGVGLVVLTGRDKGQARAAKLSAIADGSAQLVIGTHALFQQDVVFADLRLAVIDEQHRFGVRQRLELTEKAPSGCDVLVMTATPIPRTLALAGYGDLDISTLDEKPPGRQPVETRLISLERYQEVVERLRVAISEGRRAYWVCPLVEESEISELVAAEDRFRALSDALGVENVGLVHGQLSADDKDTAMRAFKEGLRKVLVATTVIEVGVDIPDATIMVIEQAERFGLAQLHQLRGRVGRGAGRSFCLLLFSPPLGEAARARLDIMRETEDGFRIAEEDLRIRGAGDVLGTTQAGLPRFRIADLDSDGELMHMARDDARMVLNQDPDLAGRRGKGLKTLLYLMDRDKSVRLMKGG